MNVAVLAQECSRSIAKGSKTFNFASKFFDREKMADAAMLYQWCRYCDDQVDQCAENEKVSQVNKLKMLTMKTINGEQVDDISFQALALLIKKHKIPTHYPMELIEGMATDAYFNQPKTWRDLEVYCYRVAGVVGLMMAHVMGVSREEALQNACDLGMAMQLTNISRDVLDDAKMGRCYLPEEVLQKYQMDSHNFSLQENRANLAEAVAEILNRAEEFYCSGQKGTRYLDLRSSLVILIARFTYARIGKKVVLKGARAWEKRQFTSKFEKIWCLGQALSVWVSELFVRPKWRQLPIQRVWRFE